MVGAGMSQFGAFPHKTSRDLFADAYQDMLASIDKPFDPAAIESIFVGNFSSDVFEGQAHVAPMVTEHIGLVPRAATRVENACASAGVAIRQGVMAIASGLYDIVLVGGTERMNALPTPKVTEALASAGDRLYEINAGFTFPGFYATIASAYMHKYGMAPEHLMKVAQKNHDNGALNPKAQFNVSIKGWMEKRKASAEKKGRPVPTWETEMDFFHDDKANPMIAWPLRLFDCSPITDGGACILLVAEDRAKDFTDTPLHIIGTGQASDYPLHGREDMTTLSAAKLSAQEAYAMAGVSAQDIKLAEVHDCFTIAEVIATEDLGFFKAGQGFKAAEEGQTARDGSKPINTSGGLKAKGHPVGASGVGQAVEIFKQMRGQAGERQVKGDLNVGLTHNVGATGNTCVIHVYERRK